MTDIKTIPLPSDAATRVINYNPSSPYILQIIELKALPDGTTGVRLSDGNHYIEGLIPVPLTKKWIESGIIGDLSVITLKEMVNYSVIKVLVCVMEPHSKPGIMIGKPIALERAAAVNSGLSGVSNVLFGRTIDKTDIFAQEVKDMLADDAWGDQFDTVVAFPVVVAPLPGAAPPSPPDCQCSLI